MSFVLAELRSVLIALAPLVVGAGALFARALRFPGFARADLVGRAGKALLVGLACLPVLLELAGRLGPGAMAATALALGIAGLPSLAAGAQAPRLDPPVVVLAAAWIVVAALLPLDWPDAEGLRHGALVIDHVKHAAATWSIAESGTPPWNPTFFEPGRPAIYYYFFYTLTGAVTVLGDTLGVAGRHAAVAGCVLMGFALVALAENLVELSGAAAPPRRALWTALLVLTTGLDLIPYAFVREGLGLTPPDAEWWNDQVSSWFVTALWAPHHLAALCAACVGFVALAFDRGWRSLALGALAFASTAGLSVYVAIGAAVALVLWAAWATLRGRFVDVARLVAMGAGSLVLAAPWLALVAMRTQDGRAPLGLAVRTPYWTTIVCEDGPACATFKLALAPLLYAFEFGVFALGAIVFWRAVGRRGLDNELAKLLVCATAASFLAGTFVRSTLILNDLGWRVMLFAQVATLVWTLAALRNRAFGAGALSRAAVAALVLGYGMVALTAVQARREPEQTALQRQTLPEEIAAWTWLSANLPKGAVAQSQPRQGRALSYGLYGRFPAYVSDLHNGVLFGASERDVRARLDETAPIFAAAAAGGRTLEEVRAFAARHRIAAIVVTALDSAFADPAGWTAQAKPVYETQRVRIFLFGDFAK